MSGGFPVHNAVRSGNVSVLKQLLDDGAEVGSKDDNGETPLHCARSSDCVRMLLNRKAPVNLKNNDGMTPLHYAVQYCNLDLMELLLMDGANVNDKTNVGQTPLHFAVRSGSPEKIDTILQSGADIDSQDCNGDTPLLIALQASHDQVQEVCSLLLKRGADVQLQNERGDTPLNVAIVKNTDCVPLILKSVCGKKTVQIADKLGDYPIHYAVRSGNIDVLKQLLDNGAVVDCKNKNGETPLHCVRSSDNVRRMLLDRGAAVDVKDNYSMTPLQYAAKYCNPETMKILLMNGADFNLLNHSGEHMLHLAVMSGRSENIEFVLQSGADINVLDFKGNTPLHIALKRVSLCHVEEVSNLLLERGANLELRDKRGQKPLHVAINMNIPSCVLLIIKSSLDKNLDQIKSNPDYLHIVAKMGNLKLIDLLLDNGAEINCQDKFGMTPLHKVWSFKCLMKLIDRGALLNVKDNGGMTPVHKVWSIKCLMKLLDRGALVNVKDNEGMTPLHHAVKCNKTKVLKVLLMKGADINCRDVEGRTPLMYARSLDCASLLLQMGADVTIQDNNGGTILHQLVARMAIRGPTYDSLLRGQTGKILDILLDDLLNCGSSLTVKDNSGKTPLSICRMEIMACAGRYEIRKYCVNLPNRLDSVLHLTRYYHIYYHNYQISCYKEVGKLKLKRYGSHSLFDIFSQHTDYWVARNKGLERKVNQNNLKKHFPIYSSLLKIKYKRVKERADWLEAITDSLQTPLVPEIVLFILSFLDDVDLLRIHATL